MPDRKDSGAQKPSNRLIHETSPYLLQHAYNPVQWHPWGEEALRAARTEDKPILLSVGYSACHWCHVMERESFENKEIAALMNAHFINVKVDREERPDVDSLYMNFVQMTTGHGGWPLTVFLTPDGLPFYGGTYFPPEDMHGRPGFRQVLGSVAEFYRTRKGEIEKNREELRRRLEEAGSLDVGVGRLQEELLTAAFDSFLQQFDRRHGGFGRAPKFPQAAGIGFLLRYHDRFQTPSALEAAEMTLEKMACGGIYDQIGGGFHRYSVDDEWLAPHFEKMLYDNALLANVYLEGHLATGREFFREKTEEILEYVRRDLMHPEGGFFSAEDADSEGVEGRFYVWSPSEVEAILGREESRLFCAFYDVTDEGNWEGVSILRRTMSLEDFARRESASPEELQRQLQQGREKLRAARGQRVRPALDDKVLTSWNGLMLKAFARAGWVLGRDDFLQLARSNADFLLAEMASGDRILRTWKDGRGKLGGYLEDYAFVIEGLLALYEAGGDVQYLNRARHWMSVQLNLFYDADAGDFYFTASDHEKLLVRQKEFFDNAVPSGNSVSALNLLRLAELTGDQAYRRTAVRLLERIANALARYPTAFGNWLQALDLHLGPIQQLVAVGAPAQRGTLLRPARERFLPRLVLAQSERIDPELTAEVPLFAERSVKPEEAVAYLCENFTCREPARTPEELARQL